ncbi:PDZ domain-containing protein 8 [Elysia marginata]|uniref:PDZ domain-containing protein 8 n=1 Tax=Elysia marginata TaxID=1093978 RepID=A0AAV4I4N6_9GAST|nr:PDZ domain-containing protein 8 [Elysia marginata]
MGDQMADAQSGGESLLGRAWTYVDMFPPTHYLLVLANMYLEFLMDRGVLVLLSFLGGVLALLALEAVVFWRLYNRVTPQSPPQFKASEVRMPDVLKSRLADDVRSKKEDGAWFNFFLQFMFSELQDSLQLRRFLTKKIQTEFEEILRSRSGILVDELYLRDFNLGDNFPVFMGISVDKSDVVADVIQTLDIRARIMYDGGFQIAVDAALPFGRVAFVSVQVLKVRGLLRFRFSRHPFSHWCMSFYEEPEIDLDVSAQLDGRPMPKLKGIFANQIRRIIRKKHTLPMYKMRFKPFFYPHVDTERSSGQSIRVDGVEVGHGVFEVLIKGASRLRFIPKGAYFYCTASVDALPWKQKVAEERKKREIVTVELNKISADQSLGMTVKDELLPDRLYPVVVIAGIIVGMPAHMANLKDGEILVGVSGTKVFSAKEAMKSLKWTKENKIEIQIERRELQQEYSDDLTVNSKSSNDAPNGSPKLVTRSLPPSAHSSQASLENTSNLTGSSRRTLSKLACENPTWNQKFIFTVDPGLHYLNVCLWSKGGDYSGSSEVLKSAKHDVLVGYASLNLDDIYLHCLITLNGSLSDRIKLKHGHYKTEAELIKEWSVHKGWDPNQMYGDLSLGFHFHPTQLSPEQRLGLASCRATSSKAGLDTFLLQADALKGMGASSPSSKENNKDRTSSVNGNERVTFGPGLEDKSREHQEGHHQFESTTFISATFCDYCGRKIWMKDAFKCRTCNMVCHKKCLVKCLVNTVCTESGVRKRNAEDEVWKPLQATGKPTANTVRLEYDGRKTAKDEEVDLDNAEDTMSADRLSSQNLSSLLEVIYSPGQDPGSPHRLRSESLPEVGQQSRFRNLKEQTDRMKDNVLKHLRRNKTPSALSDKAIHSAKQVGAQLFADMDPLLRKDKLEEMVRKLDDQLILEMQNKESLEQHLAHLETEQLNLESTGSSPGSSPQHTPATSNTVSRHREIKTLHQKVDKSGEKVDALRLLMLQYCSGLQNCINSLETEDGDGKGVGVNGSKANNTNSSPSSSVSAYPSTVAIPSEDSDSPKPDRKRTTFGGMSQGVGGLVRRASSSVKEKMSSFKEFGRKSTGRAAALNRAVGQNETSEELLQSGITSERNNSGLNPILENREPAQVLQKNTRSKSDGQVENLFRLAETPSSKSSSTMEISNMIGASLFKDTLPEDDSSLQTSEAVAQTTKYPEVEIHVESPDSPNGQIVKDKTRKKRAKTDEPKHLLKEALEDGLQILRSRSDSTLEVKTGDSRLSPAAGNRSIHGNRRGNYYKPGPTKTSNLLSPRHILSYHGSSSSLPQLFPNDDSDSDNSDYVVIESSDDEAPHSDSTSDYDYDDEDGVLNTVTDVTFEGEPKVTAIGSVVGAEKEDSSPEHRAIIQHLHTYQV